MLNKFKKLFKLTLYEQCNIVSMQYAKFKTQYFYSLFFKNIGQKSIIKNPIFLSNIAHISIGKNVFIRDHSRLECVLEKNEQRFIPHLVIEDGVSIEQRCHITAADTLIIKKNTMISFDVSMQDTDHEYQDLSMSVGKQPLMIKKTQIGENCFIGSGAKIQAGTILGRHCVVGSNAVVRGTFPDYSVIVGAPARIVKRYDEKSQKWKKTNNKGEFIDEI
jgi:acetyltransferase-like isoleucine patch superfamily enzyme